MPSESRHLFAEVDPARLSSDASHDDAGEFQAASIAFDADRLVRVLVSGQPRWTDPSLADLARERGAATALLALFDRHGDAFPAHLHGPFAACIIDGRGGRVLGATDRIGRHRLYYSQAGGKIRISTDLGRIAKTLGPNPSMDPQALYDFVYFHVVPAPRTIYADVRALQIARLLVLQGGSETVRRYWQPGWGTGAPAESATRDAMFDALRAAVTDSLPAAPGPIGCFLSGGLDSSTVAGIASQVRPATDIHAFSIGFAESDYDESHYARTAAEHFGLHWHRHELTPEEVLDSLPAIVAGMAQPFANSSALAVYHCARFAREHGFDQLLAGDGGDELFGGNSRYAKQLLFERYQLLPRWLRTGLVEPAVSTAARLAPAGPLRKLRNYIDQSNVPLPDRLQSYNFLHRHDPVEIFDPAVLAAADRTEPLRLMREEYLSLADSEIDRMLALDWRFTLHDNDLVKVNEMCAAASVGARYPLLDERIIDLACALPPDWKVRSGELRWFFRRAVRGFLPDEIIDKKKHGFGLPFGVWTRKHEGLNRLASDSLDRLESRGLFRPDFLRRTLAMHRDVHAAYYGELVWILMILELWLQSHALRTTGSAD